MLLLLLVAWKTLVLPVEENTKRFYCWGTSFSFWPLELSLDSFEIMLKFIMAGLEKQNMLIMLETLFI